jgi:hypothetical protein
MTTTVCRVSGSSRHLAPWYLALDPLVCVGRPLVLRRRVLVWWLCAGFGCSVGLTFPLGGSFVGVLLFCFQCRTAHAAMHGWSRVSLWLARRLEKA